MCFKLVTAMLAPSVCGTATSALHWCCNCYATDHNQRRAPASVVRAGREVHPLVDIRGLLGVLPSKLHDHPRGDSRGLGGGVRRADLAHHRLRAGVLRLGQLLPAAGAPAGFVGPAASGVAGGRRAGSHHIDSRSTSR